MNNANQQIETTALVNMSPEQRAAIVLDSGKAEAQLRDMLVKSADIVDIKDKDGRTMAHNAAMQLKVARVSIEKTGKAAREDAQAFSKAVIAEEKRLTAIILPEEDRLLGLRNEYDRKIEAEKQERERKERERVAAIQGRINAIKHLPIDSANDTADQLQQTIDDLSGLIVGDDFAEFKDEAMDAKLAAINSLTLMVGAAKASEAEAARLQAERKRLDEMRAEEEARLNAERAKFAEERRQGEARQQVEREKLEAQRAELEALRAQLADAQAAAVKIKDVPVQKEKVVEPVTPALAEQTKGNFAPSGDELREDFGRSIASEVASVFSEQILAMSKKLAMIGIGGLADELSDGADALVGGLYDHSIAISDMREIARLDMEMLSACKVSLSLVSENAAFINN